MTAFHEVLLPTDFSEGSHGGPQRRTQIVTLRGGAEERNALWANSRRRFDLRYSIKTYAKLQELVAFWEERNARLIGFRFRDWSDWRSRDGVAAITASDQLIGAGDGSTRSFQLAKTYGSAFAPYVRAIRKPIAGSVRVAVASIEQMSGWSVDTTTGVVTFNAAPALGQSLRAGFEFDVPARFDTDELDQELRHFQIGSLGSIPVIEIPV